MKLDRPELDTTEVAEFQKAFPDEASCAAFLFERRWPDGFGCPVCGNGHAAALKSRAYTYEWIQVAIEFSYGHAAGLRRLTDTAADCLNLPPAPSGLAGKEEDSREPGEPGAARESAPSGFPVPALGEFPMSNSSAATAFDFRKRVAYDDDAKRLFHRHARRQLRLLADALGTRARCIRPAK